MFRNNKIHFTSLGCARNLVDTEVMLGLVLKAGYEVTAEVGEADFLVVNTCGFLQSAREEAMSIIQEIFSEKKQKAKIIVAGCMVQNHKNHLQEHFPDIHYFLGSGDTEKILEAVRSDEKGMLVSDARSYLNLGEVPRALATPNHYAYLKIAEGCKKRCSFCIIPTIKGPLKSKSLEQVMKEFQALLHQNVFEVILIAQDLGDYGKDKKISMGLHSLLQSMLKIKKDFWLRMLYLYPDEISDEIISLLAEDHRLCPYVDMPLQHINDDILKAMHRKTSKDQIIKIIEKLKTQVPHVVIRTSLMVGFPGETESQFQELVEFIKDYPLDQIGIFKYSKEEASYSAKLLNHLSEEVKEERFQILAKTQQEVLKKTMKKYIGKSLKVLVEGVHPESPYLLKGRFQGQAPEVDGEVIINDARKVDELGALYEVKITDCLDYDLVGRAVKKLNSRPFSKPSSPLTILS